jgi:hypothetical protein
LGITGLLGKLANRAAVTAFLMLLQPNSETSGLSVRQWVLSVPKRLRYFMQRDGAVFNLVQRIFLRVISQSLKDHCAGAASADKAALHIGAVAFIHRFGSSLNGPVHFHVCVVDGVLEEVEPLH